MSRIRLTRRVAFSSGHRYWKQGLSEVENRELFGPWASPFNHGHNYLLDVTCEGELDTSTGMVVNIKRIDDVLQGEVVARFDQKSINDEVGAFRDLSPSVENLLQYFSSNLSGLPDEVVLTALRLEETPLLYGEWHRNQEVPVTLTRVYEFAASHRLHSEQLSNEQNLAVFGKCNNPNGHGHNYVLEVTVGGAPDERTGMIVDIGALDRVVESEVVDRYDHRNLSLDMPEFKGKNPTSEVVAMEIFKRLEPALPVRLERVRLYETARNMFEVVRE